MEERGGGVERGVLIIAHATGIDHWTRMPLMPGRSDCAVSGWIFTRMIYTSGNYPRLPGRCYHTPSCNGLGYSRSSRGGMGWGVGWGAGVRACAGGGPNISFGNFRPLARGSRRLA